MAPEGAVQVVGGNWQVPHNMVIKSGAYVQLNTSVVNIDLVESDSERSKYKLKTKSDSAAASADATEYPVSFDKIVLAGNNRLSVRSVKIFADGEFIPLLSPLPTRPPSVS